MKLLVHWVGHRANGLTKSRYTAKEELPAHWVPASYLEAADGFQPLRADPHPEDAERSVQNATAPTGL